MRIASITAGAAGMVCGSCIKDNTLAAALGRLGHDCQLLPTFTPPTLDEPDHSTPRVFLGGVNVYLDEYRAFRWVPRALRGWLDRPWVLNIASRFAGVEDYQSLGELTLSMLRGDAGRQADEFAVLLRYLEDEFRPDVVLLTNVLLSAAAPILRSRLGVPVVATLQGDDVFLDALTEWHRAEAVALIGQNGGSVAGFIATCADYADRMAAYLGLPRAAVEVVYPGISVAHYDGHRPTRPGPPTIGYLARIAPEKGLHHLAEAFIELRRRPNVQPARLRFAGWLGGQHRGYLDGVMRRLAEAGLAGDVDHVPVPTLADKVAFLRSLDLFSVPTTFREPKGLYVLEALAAGVPVVLPRHGSFPELVAQTGGGRLVSPESVTELSDSLGELIADPESRAKLAQQGRTAVFERFTDARMAADTVAVLQKYVGAQP